MATPEKRAGNTPGSTGDYSATEAPENREHVESEQEPTRDPSLTPGGAHGVPFEVGMAGLYRENVPSQAEDLGLTDYGSNPAAERQGSGKE